MSVIDLDTYELKIKLGSVCFTKADDQSRFYGTLKCGKPNAPKTVKIAGSPGRGVEFSFLRMLKIVEALGLIPTPFVYNAHESDKLLTFHTDVIPESYVSSVLGYTELYEEKTSTEQRRNALNTMRSIVLEHASGEWEKRFVTDNEGSLKSIERGEFNAALNKYTRVGDIEFDNGDIMMNACMGGYENGCTPEKFYRLDWKDFYVKFKEEKFGSIMKMLRF